MGRKLIVNRTCPLCRNLVPDVPDYILRTSEDHQNVEWVQTKRGLKQYFHTSCYAEMIERQKQQVHA